MIKSLISILAIIVILVILGLLAAYYEVMKGAFSMMLILVALVTFFGLLLSPGGLSSDGSLKESRIRFCITATLVVTYVVYFGTTAFWKEEISELEKEMISTLTTLLAVALPFYFGASAAVAIKDAADK